MIARSALPGSHWLDLFWPLFGAGVMLGAFVTKRRGGAKLVVLLSWMSFMNTRVPLPFLTSSLTLVFGELAVRGAGRVCEQGFGITQIGTQRKRTQAVKHMEGACTRLLRISRLDIKRQHRTAHV